MKHHSLDCKITELAHKLCDYTQDNHSLKLYQLIKIKQTMQHLHPTLYNCVPGENWI